MSRNKRRHPKRANNRNNITERWNQADFANPHFRVQWMVANFDDVLRLAGGGFNILHAMKAPVEPLLAIVDWVNAVERMWRELTPEQREVAITLHLLDKRPLDEALETARRV